MIPPLENSLGSQGPRVLVIQPHRDATLDRFGTWLSDEGFSAQVVQPFNGDIVPSTVQEDALVVLGGDMSSLDDHAYDWLANIRLLIVDAASRKKPVLGICLGGQLMAQAFGGAVERGDRGLEAGLVRVTWRPEAATDPLTAGLPDPFFVGAFHGDAVTQLPPSAVWLGATTQYPHQAFRVGEESWGLQFHPEVSPTTYRQWLSLIDESDPLTVQRADQGMKDLQSQDEAVIAHTEMLARRFARFVLARKAGRAADTGMQ